MRRVLTRLCAAGVIAAAALSLAPNAALAGAVPDPEPARDTCVLIIRKTGGADDEERAMPNLSVVEMTRAEAPARIEPIPGYEVKGFLCDRPDFVPYANDWRVLKAGYTLWIRVRGREDRAVLRLLGGNVSFAMARSGTDDEDRRARERMSQFTPHFSRPIAAMAAADPGPEPTQDECGLVVRRPGNDRLEVRAVPGLSVMKMGSFDEKTMKLPSVEGYEIVGLICDRDTVVPASSDVLVLMAGTRLWIRVKARRLLAVIFMFGDKLRFDSRPGGDIPDAEIARIIARLGRYQAYRIPPGPEQNWGWPVE